VLWVRNQCGSVSVRLPMTITLDASSVVSAPVRAHRPTMLETAHRTSRLNEHTQEALATLGCSHHNTSLIQRRHQDVTGA